MTLKKVGKKAATFLKAVLDGDEAVAMNAINTAKVGFIAQMVTLFFSVDGEVRHQPLLDRLLINGDFNIAKELLKHGAVVSKPSVEKWQNYVLVKKGRGGREIAAREFLQFVADNDVPVWSEDDFQQSIAA